MSEEKKFLDQKGLEFLWSKISMEDYPNNETLIAVLNAIDTTKQDKNIIVTKGSDELATHSPAEILEAVNNGINVYYTPNINAGTLHPYLEGSNQVSYFHSNYIDNSRVVGTGFLIDSNKNVTVSNYSALDNYYTKTETDKQIADLVNSAPETLDTLGELATAFQENKEVVDTLNSAITNKADISIVPTNLVNGSATGSLRGVNTLVESDSYTMGINAFAIGSGTKASGKNSFASGQDVEATSSYAHAEGYGTFATAAAAHAEGYDTHATARYAHAEGASTTASGNNSHAEGNSTTSSGHYSHAEGNFTTAAGGYSHAEGNYAQTGENGTYAHAEGSYTKAMATGAHAEGNYCEANGIFSHTEGNRTLANSMYQHVRGKYNIPDNDNVYSTIIGNGDADNNRKNIHTLDWEGNAWFIGDVYVGSTEGLNKDEGSKKLATEEYVDGKIVDPTIIENKKDKDLIVTYASDSTFGVSHSTQEIYEAVQNGRTVKFQKDTELLNLMEITEDYATFFMFYMNMEGKPQQKVVVINNSSIMLDQDDTYNYATVTQLNNKADKTTLNSYYNKTEVDNLLSSTGPSDDALLKTAQTLTKEELAQVRKNLKSIGRDVEGQVFTINDQEITASANTEILGDYESNKCTGQWSIVEGSTNVATGRVCHVEGAQNQALNDGCHVEGVSCIASGYWSHAEGEMTRVTSYASHAEGSYTKMPDGTTRYGTASGYASHIEGGGCYAQGSCSHSEGLATTTKGNYSHSEGRYTIAGSPAQHVEGIANIEDIESAYIHIAGNGDWDARSNAYHLDWNGNGWFSGDVYVGSTSGIDQDEGSKKLATEEYVNNQAENSVKKYFLIVETVKEGANYLLDGITFDEISEKFNAGNVNMVCHVDGTDYIPLLSVASYQIIFSGIYNTTSVSLVFNTEGVGTLNTTYLMQNGSLSNYYTKTEVNSIQNTLNTSISNKQDKIAGNAGDFVVIGEDGNITTKTILLAEEAVF